MRCDASALAIVSGGASGLGLATASALRTQDCPVVIIDLPGSSGEQQASAIGAHFVALDITDASAAADRLSEVAHDVGIPRILVNCAGIAPAARTLSRRGRHDAELFARVMAVNLTGSFVVASIVAELMSAADPLADGERGVIINTASIAAYDGQIGQCAYAASKAGIAGMTLPMARDLATHGIRACAIAPGIFETPMVQGMPDDLQQSLATQIPFPQRFGRPNEFAALALHIIENTMLNGEVIRLDGAVRMGAS